MMRLSLEEIALRAKTIIGSTLPLKELFQMMPDCPPPKNVDRALSLLRLIQAFDEKECLTPIGQFISSLPVNVRIGKLILCGILFKCLDPILTICATLSAGKSPFGHNPGNPGETKRAQIRYFKSNF